MHFGLEFSIIKSQLLHGYQESQTLYGQPHSLTHNTNVDLYIHYY